MWRQRFVLDTLTGEHYKRERRRVKIVLVHAGGDDVAPKVRPGYPTGEQYKREKMSEDCAGARDDVAPPFVLDTPPVSTSEREASMIVLVHAGDDGAKGSSWTPHR
jgi:hypothetical protein